MPDFDLVRAINLARASRAAYLETSDSIAGELGGFAVQTFAFGPVFGYLARGNDDRVLAFRGTASPLETWETAIKQWITNIDFDQIAGHDGKVHRGFSTALEPAWQTIRQLVGSESARLWVTGHSLGGALAILAGARLFHEGCPPKGVYTFGAPCVGDDAFSRAYQVLLHRVEHANDIVCHLPPPPAIGALVGRIVGKLNVPGNASYKHAGVLTYLPSGGQRQTVIKEDEHRQLSAVRLSSLVAAALADASGLVKDHSIASYVSRLALADSSQSLDRTKALLRDLASKVLMRLGPMIFDRNSGKPEAIIQEAGTFQPTLGTGGHGGILLSPAELLTTIQKGNAELAAMLRGLQMLNVASLAAAVVGIGVSVAGFALVLNRLKQVQLTLEGIKDDAAMARLVAERVDLRASRENWARTQALLKLAEAAWHHTDPVPRWKELMNPLFQQQTFEQCLVGSEAGRSILLDNRFEFEEAVQAYESTLILASAHSQTLLLVGQERAALHHAEEFHKWHTELIVPIDPVDMVNPRVSATDADERSRRRRKAESFKQHALEIDRQLAGRVQLVRYLIDKGVSGRAYIEAAREQTGSPILLLPVSS